MMVATMVAEQTAERLYSVEEYFELERRSEVRHEYVNGKLYEMLGESKVANKISGNIYIELRRIFEDTPLDVFDHDVRMCVHNGKRYRYPDIVVAIDGDDNWQSIFLEKLDDVIELREFKASISLKQIYRKIIFPQATS